MARRRSEFFTAGPPSPAAMADVRLGGTTRAEFIMRGVLATGAAYGLGAVGPFVDRALAQTSPSDTGKSDVEILNFALTLEWLEAFFYERALAGAVSLSREVKTLVEEIASNERDHAEFLTGAIKVLGGKPGRVPAVTFPFSDEKAFLGLAQTFEDTGVFAYNAAGPLLESPAVLNNAGQIVQLEGRHAGAIRWVRGQNVTDGALDGVLTFQEVVDRFEPYLVDPPRSFQKPPPPASL